MDKSSELYFDSRRPVKDPFPTERAQLLCILNPETFKHQNIEDKLGRIVRREYRKSLDEYKEQR